MDFSDPRKVIPLLVGTGFVLIALLAFISFARPQLQKLAKNTVWQVPQMGLKGIIGPLIFLQLCMVFGESLKYPESKGAFFPYLVGYLVICAALTKVVHMALKRFSLSNLYIDAISNLAAPLIWQIGILFLTEKTYALVTAAASMHIIH